MSVSFIPKNGDAAVGIVIVIDQMNLIVRRSADSQSPGDGAAF
ncbi:MAG: hypothetical protein WBN03_16605 [Desulfobacterales bacterium]